MNGASSSRGIALIAVLVVLGVLLAMIGPFLLSMGHGDAAARARIDEINADWGAKSVRDLALAKAARGVFWTDATPMSDGRDEFPATLDLPESFASMQKGLSGRNLLQVEVEDEQRRIDLDSATPLVLANLLGTVTRVRTEVDAEATEISCDGPLDAFPESGMLLVGREVIAYGARDGDRFVDLKRGQLAELGFFPAPSFPDYKVAEQSLVLDFRCVLAVMYPHFGDGDPTTRNPYGSVREVARIATLGLPGFTADELDLLERFCTVSSLRENSAKWGKPERVFAIVEDESHERCILHVRSAAALGAGRVVRMRSTDDSLVEYRRRRLRERGRDARSHQPVRSCRHRAAPTDHVAVRGDRHRGRAARAGAGERQHRRLRGAGGDPVPGSTPTAGEDPDRRPRRHRGAAGVRTSARGRARRSHPHAARRSAAVRRSVAGRRTPASSVRGVGGLRREGPAARGHRGGHVRAAAAPAGALRRPAARLSGDGRGGHDADHVPQRAARALSRVGGGAAADRSRGRACRTPRRSARGAGLRSLLGRRDPGRSRGVPAPRSPVAVLADLADQHGRDPARRTRHDPADADDRAPPCDPVPGRRVRRSAVPRSDVGVGGDPAAALDHPVPVPEQSLRPRELSELSPSRGPRHRSRGRLRGRQQRAARARAAGREDLRPQPHLVPADDRGWPRRAPRGGVLVPPGPARATDSL